MPVEIRELIIRATTTSEKESVTSTVKRNVTVDKEAVINACVRRVLKIMRKSKER